jgi:filamentous hemagglutinin family protein
MNADGVRGHLATITTPQEQDRVRAVLGSNLAWLGGSDAGDEGGFTWRTGPEAGDALTFSAFNPGEPNNAGGEDFLDINNEGGWNDSSRTRRLSYLVEFEGSRLNAFGGRGGNATAGAVSILGSGAAIGLGEVSITSRTTAGAGGVGSGTGTNGLGGIATGASVLLQANGGSLALSGLNVDTRAFGGLGETGGAATAGNVTLRAINTGRLSITGSGGADISGDASGGASTGGSVGFGRGGNLLIEADGGTVEFGYGSLDASLTGTAGFGGANGSEGRGGDAMVVARGGGLVAIAGSTNLVVSGFGRGAALGGAGRGGSATVLAEADSRVSTDFISMIGFGRGGQGTAGVSGEGAGGTLLVRADGGRVETNGATLIALGTGGSGTSAGIGRGGSVTLSAGAGGVVAAEEGRMTLQAEGQGGSGSEGARDGAGGSGGQGFGGTVRLATQGGVIQIDPAVELALSAVGRGGAGGAGGLPTNFETPGGAGGTGGAGTGGSVAIDVIGGTIGFGEAGPADVRIDVSGVGGAGGQGGRSNFGEGAGPAGPLGGGSVGSGGTIGITVRDLNDGSGTLVTAGRLELGATTLIARGSEGEGSTRPGGRAGAITIRESAQSNQPSLIFERLTVLADNGLPTFSFRGSLPTESSVASFDFVSELGGTVIAQSYGYDGGVNRAGEQISAGGFDPILTIRDARNSQVAENDDGPSGFDSFLRTDILPGSYKIQIRAFGGAFDGRTAEYAFDLFGADHAVGATTTTSPLLAGAPATTPAFQLSSTGPDFVSVTGSAAIRVTGDALFSNPDAANGSISGGLQVGTRLDVSATGTIRISGSQLAGTRIGAALQGAINLTADSIIAASPGALADLAALDTVEARGARLGTNDGTVVADGYLAAADVTLRAANRIWVQNTGGNDSSDARRGITVGPNTLTIISDKPDRPTEIIINARAENGEGGFVTGQAMLEEADLGQANAATGSSINSCDLETGVCSGDAPPPPPVITGFVGTPNVVNGGATVSQDNSFINILGSRAIINWTAAATDFLPTDHFAEFSGSSDFIVLNRVLASDQTQAIQLNGRIDSLVNGFTGRGKVWFYSPSGILVGAGARINVGSLLLSASNLSDGDFLDGNNSFAFSRADSLASVQIARGAEVTARDPNAYLALLAPRVRQSADVVVNGGATYVAAESVTATITGALFDIAVAPSGGTSVGGTTSETAALVHDGSTTLVNTDVEGGYGPAVVSERKAVLVAVPKNDAVTMLVSGAFDYQPAEGATPVGSRVLLSAGHDIVNGAISASAPAGATGPANILISNAGADGSPAQTVFNTDVTARATGSVAAVAVNTGTVDPDLGIRRADLIFGGQPS